MIWTPKLIEARDLAREGHDSINQKRKYTGEPYWVHTEDVAEIVAGVTHTEDMLIAALYHDWIEDVFPVNPKYNIDLIKEKFGVSVANMVMDLTDEYTKEKYPLMNRATRKKMERERIAGISKESKTLKLADLISNTSSIVEHDKDFAHVYLREIMETLPHLVEGNSELLQRASIQALAGFKLLGIEIPVLKAN